MPGKEVDEIPNFLKPSGDTPDRSLRNLLVDLKNISKNFIQGTEGGFRSKEGMIREAKQILGAFMGQRSDEVSQRIQNLSEQALGEIKSGNFEKAGETIQDILRASPNIRFKEGSNSMGAEDLLDEEDADVGEFLEDQGKEVDENFEMPAAKARDLLNEASDFSIISNREMGEQFFADVSEGAILVGNVGITLYETSQLEELISGYKW